MNNVDVRVILQKAVKEELGNQVQFQLEGVAFTPDPKKPYVRITVLKSQLDNPTMGDGFNREPGLLQLMLSFPSGEGTANIESAAWALRERFKRGTTYQEGTDRILIHKAPYEARADESKPGWIQLPVYVPYIVDVYQ